MKKAWLWLGIVVFWCSWPALWLYMFGSKRTRLLIVCGDEYLVVRGRIGSGSWGLPGGGLHKSEDSVTGLLREVHEETGIELMPNQLKFMYKSEYNDYGFKFTYDCYSVVIAKKPNVQTQKLEILDYAWLKLNSPISKLTGDGRDAIASWHKTQGTNNS